MAKRKSNRQSSTPRSPRTRASQAEPVKDLNLAEEYHYVIADLRNMALIALVLIAGLVVLSFFL